MLYFHVRVALLKCDFLRVPCTESWTSWAQLKAENLRNPKMVLHVPIAAPKLELLASKPNRAFFWDTLYMPKIWTYSVFHRRAVVSMFGDF